MIELRNDGAGFGFGISGSRNSGAVVRNIFPGGAADRVRTEPMENQKGRLITKNILTLFRLVGYKIETCQPFSLYLLHGFRSESEQPYWNMVK